jgi:chemotaxis family two-component system response regulator Rcp1
VAAPRVHILIVEDNRADVFLIREALREASVDAELQVVADGEKAVAYFEAVDADDAKVCPALMILDINLPRRHGGEVLEEMRMSRRCAHTRVLVVTSSDSADDRAAMARYGADAYFRKPSDYEEFLKLGVVVGRLLAKPVSGPEGG